MADNSAAIDFVRQNAVADDSGNYRIAQKKYMEYMASQGIPKEVMQAYREADTNLLNAMYEFNAEEMLKRCDEDKKNGDDPSKRVIKLNVTVPDGAYKMITYGAKQYPLPNKSGETITKTMVTRLTIDQDRKLDRALCVSYEKKLADLLGVSL